ncbi:MAG: hypothetical protein IT424_12845 [Pirellulales bacterium]|nr:hypothetical protein [Pirellulales bacterium]
MNSRRIGSVLGLVLALLALTACDRVPLDASGEARAPGATTSPMVTVASDSANRPAASPSALAIEQPIVTLAPTEATPVQLNRSDVRDATVIPATQSPSQNAALDNAESTKTVTANQVIDRQTLKSTISKGAAIAESQGARSDGSISASQSQVNINITSSSSVTGGQAQTQTVIGSTSTNTTSSTGSPSAESQPFPTMQPIENAGGDEAGEPGDNQKIYQLCGQDDPGMARAIEQFIAGRGFSAQLISHSGNCPNLKITVPAGSTAGTASGSQQTHLTVKSGGRSVQVDIVSENGVTRANIGSGA